MTQFHIRPLGELGARCALLMGRLEAPVYRPDFIFTADQNGWPGDWEGRTILALSRLSAATGRTPSYLDEIVASIPAHLNAKGYLGEIMPDGALDEQQLSGHSWLLRGLYEYSVYSGNGTAREMADQIVESLYLPARGRFSAYPADPEARQNGGAEAGNIAGEMGGFRVSTDTGCAFIALDGLSRAYEISRDARVKALVDEMIDAFLGIDLLAVRAQTHATLSATRGILRMYAATGEKSRLDAARRIFDLYLAHGMTANYANYNWFGRPEWTEPCAIIDSFLVAMQLYIHTKDARYLPLARRILRNGVFHAQRPNGGFGCDSCTGPTDFLFVHAYEAYWCCTMRGGEGLAAAAEYAYLVNNDEIELPYFVSSRAALNVGGGEIHLWQRADGAQSGRVQIEIEKNTATRPVRLLTPAGAFDLPGAGGALEIRFDVPVCREGRRVFCGDDMLATDADIERIDVSRLERTADGFLCDGARLFALSDDYLLSPDEVRARCLRVLFD
jgi:hypothetical protein